MRFCLNKSDSLFLLNKPFFFFYLTDKLWFVVSWNTWTSHVGYDSLGTNNKRNKTCQRNENTILTQSSLTLLFYLFIYFPQASRAGGLAYKILYWKKRHEIKYFFFFFGSINTSNFMYTSNFIYSSVDFIFFNVVCWIRSIPNKISF